MLCTIPSSRPHVGGFGTQAWQQKMRARQQAASEAAEKGQSAAEVEKAVKAVTRAQDAAWAEREAALLAAEGVARREAAEAARQIADASLSPEIRRILLARVRIGGSQRTGGASPGRQRDVRVRTRVSALDRAQRPSGPQRAGRRGQDVGG